MALFVLHGLLKEKYRIATYLGLKIMKGYAPYIFLVAALTIQENTLVLIGLIGGAIYYAIPYYTRKLDGKLKVDLLNTKNTFIRIIIILSLTIITAYIHEISLMTTSYFLIIIIAHHIIFNSLRTIKSAPITKEK